MIARSPLRKSSLDKSDLTCHEGTIKVLITGMGSTTAISVAKGLRNQAELPVCIVGVDTHSESEVAGACFCDRFYRIPRADAPGYIETLLDICKSEEVRILWPIVDLELEYVSQEAERFRHEGIAVWVSNHETIMICNDKWRTFQFFRRHGIPTAMSWTKSGALEQADRLPFPLVVKPVKGVSSKDVFRVGCLDELEYAFRRVEEPIVQEMLKGQEYTIDVLCDYTGRALAAVPRIRLETRSGISYRGKTVRDEELIEAGMRIAGTLGIAGHCNIQCFKEGDSAARFLEINPRFSGSLPLTIRAGLNSPLLTVLLSLGRQIPESMLQFQENVVMLRYWEEHFVEQ